MVKKKLSNNFLIPLDVCYESTCQGKYDGFHADTTQACRRFFRCSAGKIVSYENCRNGMLHNGKVCDYAEKVTCDLPKSTAIAINSQNVPSSRRNCDECKFLPDGLHSDESSKDCKSYIKCFNGKSSRHRCPSSSVFNPSDSTCVPDTIYECPKSARLEKLCTGKTDGYYIDPRFSCNNFIKCLHGNAVQSDKCGKGQTFDAERKICAFTTNQQCRHETFSTDCSSLEMGYYQNRSLESSCRNYFFCYNGRKTSFSCKTGNLFNGEACVDESSYSCPNLEQDSCDTKEDGYYKDNNLGCRSYFYCSSNRKYSFLCKDGQAFDGNKCISKRHVEACSKSSDCAGKIDGYYQDLKSGCSKYFYCKQGDKVQVRQIIISTFSKKILKLSNMQILTCRNGRLFNGNSCVSPQTYTCPSNTQYDHALKLNCVQRNCHQSICSRDGFFADYDSRCKNYFFCVNGNETRISCYNNFVFNENEGLCVHPDKYKCPVFCNECS